MVPFFHYPGRLFLAARVAKYNDWNDGFPLFFKRCRDNASRKASFELFLYAKKDGRIGPDGPYIVFTKQERYALTDDS